jgi:hypothetical protein
MREKRLRKEDTEVLEYFDELIIGEMDNEGFWRDAREGEVDGIVESSAGEEESEDSYDEEDDEEEERIGSEGQSGTTRRMLNSIYTAGDPDSASADGAEESSARYEEEERAALRETRED